MHSQLITRNHISIAIDEIRSLFVDVGVVDYADEVEITSTGISPDYIAWVDVRFPMVVFGKYQANGSFRNDYRDRDYYKRLHAWFRVHAQKMENVIPILDDLIEASETLL